MAIKQSNGRVADIQDVLIHNLTALGLQTRADEIGNAQGQPDDMMGAGTSRALEELMFRAQLWAGVPEDSIHSGYTAQSLKILEKYMSDHAGLDRADIQMFIDQIQSLDAADNGQSAFDASYITGQISVADLKGVTVNESGADEPVEVYEPPLPHQASDIEDGDSPLQSRIDAYIEKQYAHPTGFGDKNYSVGSLQSDLAFLGYSPGVVDWHFGAKTQGALKAFQEGQEIGGDGTIADPGTLQHLAQKVLSFDLDAYKAALPDHQFDFVPEDSPYFLDPELIRRMHFDPQVCEYVEFAVTQAEAQGLDGVLMANQFWHESGFDPMAGSHKGAMGIAQMIPSTGAQYGLDNRSEFFDPYQSMRAGINHMKDLTDRTGDQGVALYAYNGGYGAVEFALENGAEKSFEGVTEFYLDRRADRGVTSESAWHVESLDYALKINSDHWSIGQMAKSMTLLSDPNASGLAHNINMSSNRMMFRAAVDGTAEPDIHKSPVPADADLNELFARARDNDIVLPSSEEPDVENQQPDKKAPGHSHDISRPDNLA